MLSIIAGAWNCRQYVIGAAIGLAVFSALNALLWLPAAEEKGRFRLIAEQAVESQKQELERKGDDAKLQRLSDFDLCVAYLGRVPECDTLGL